MNTRKRLLWLILASLLTMAGCVVPALPAPTSTPLSSATAPAENASTLTPHALSTQPPASPTPSATERPESQPATETPGAMPPRPGEPTGTRISVTEAGISFEIPAGWLRPTDEWAWEPPSASGERIGFNYKQRQPGVEDLTILPAGAVMQGRTEGPEGVALGRAATYQMEIMDGGQGKVQSVEQHILIVDEAMLYDFYGSAPGPDALEALEPIIRQMATSARPGGEDAATPESGAGQLVVEEYAVVVKAVDSPEHFEYMDRIDPQVLQKRKPWRDSNPQTILHQINWPLADFGHRLVLVQSQTNGTPLYQLYRSDEARLEGLSMVWPVSVREDKQDFAMVVEQSDGSTLLVSKESATPWDVMQHAWTRPVYVRNELVIVEKTGGGTYVVWRGDEVAHKFEVSQQRVDEPIKGLWSWQGHWVLEAQGEVLVDGNSLNQEMGFDEIFNWRMLGDNPFYFFRADGEYGIAYAEQALPNRYEDVIHYRCCEPAAFNPHNTLSLVAFHALREGIWYYVEAGVYDQVQPAT